MDELPEYLVSVCVVVILLPVIFFMGCVKFVSKDEQLEFENLTERMMITGPKVVYMNPFTTRKSTVHKALSLGPMKYCTVKNTLSGDRDAWRLGQNLWHPGHMIRSKKIMGMTNVHLSCSKQMSF